MRHVRTLLAALVVAPLVWILVAFGQDRAGRAMTGTGADRAVRAEDAVRALLVLGAAGLLLGLIASLRVSPLGAAVTGAAYLASYAGLLLVPDTLLDLFTRTVSVAGHRADLSTPLTTGTAALLGAMLLVAVVSVGRWRRWPRPAEAVDPPAYDPHASFGGYGFSSDAPGPGGPGYGSRYAPPAYPEANASDSSWPPETLRNGGPR